MKTYQQVKGHPGVILGQQTYVTLRQLMRLFAVKLILSYKQKCQVRSKFLKN